MSDRQPENLRPVVEALEQEGIGSLDGIAAALNERDADPQKAPG
jgi:hypothetical protein